MVQLFDRVALEGVRITADGYLTATAPVARTGIQLYAGYEIDPDNKHGLRDKATVRVNRPKAEVFSDATLRSFAHRPVTNDHPPVLVDSTNWKQYSIGQTGDEVDARDGKFVRVPLCVMDQATIEDYKAGKKELSMGYQTALDFTPGVNDDGEAYDVSQTDMRMNHLAIVRRARGGAELKIGDNQQGDRPMTDNTRTVVVDGISIETTRQGAEMISRLQSLLSDAATGHERVVATMQAQLDAANTTIATRDAALEAANARVLDAAALDAAVIARGDLISAAKSIDSTVATDGLGAEAIRLAVVTKVLGDAAIKDKPQSYIDARFDILAEDAKAGKVADSALSDAGTKPTNLSDAAVADTAFQASITNLNAWRQTA